MKALRVIGILVFSIALTPALRAGSGGSAYSIFGLGDLRYMSGSRSAGMGYTGIGVPGPASINGLSPATWSFISRTRVEAGFLLERFSSSDGSKSIALARGDFGGVLLALPVAPASGIVAVAGFTPYSNVDYHTFSSITEHGITLATQRIGSGGIGRGQIGLSYRPLSDFSVGASFNYLFGTIENETRLSPTIAQVSGGTIRENTTLRGITVTMGALYTGLAPFSLGATLVTPGNLTREYQVLYQFNESRDTSSLVSGTQKIPVSYGLGIGYQATDRYLVAADYHAQPWGSTQFNGIDPPDIRNSFRIGIGGESLPSRDASASWTDRIAYRLGFSYSETYLKINGEPINEWLITGGMAFPLFGDSRLSVAAEYGSRGTTGSELIKDNIWRMTFALNISELWFVRIEEE